MHLRKEQITLIASQVVRNLRERGTSTFKVPEDKIQERIEDVIHKNLQEEMAIEGEVKKLMEQYKDQIATGNVDAQKMYTMMKKQVAKERKFIL